jgi:transmembrane sensor
LKSHKILGIMFSNHKINWNLLAKHFAGEANERETDAISQWYNLKPENRTLYNNLKSDLMLIDKMNKQFNVDNAWEKLHDRITAHENVSEPAETMLKTQKFRLFFTPVRIAAALFSIALIGASLVFITVKFRNNTVVTSSVDKITNIKLPDGSSVYLNTDTKLSYSKKFNHKTREITLDGEAYFEVSPNKNRPFLIYADNACIRIVGTSFNVDTKETYQQVEVYVSTGIVELSEANNRDNGIVLKPGYLGTLNQNGLKSIKADNENSIAWKTRNMNFYDTQLSEVAKVLNDVYKVTILFSEQDMDTTRITGVYQDDPLDEVLNIICTQNHFTIEKSDNKIYLVR